MVLRVRPPTKCKTPTRVMGRSSEKSSLISGDFDPSILECGRCRKQLFPPVHQCANGHISCSSCLALSDRCFACAMPKGAFRCIAVELLLESLRVNCKYSSNGCQETLKFLEKDVHERTCKFVTSFCPVGDCSFKAALKDFHKHLLGYHNLRPVDVGFGIPFSMRLNCSEKYMLFRIESIYFLLCKEKQNFVTLGNKLYMAFIGTPIEGDLYSYQLEVRKGSKRLCIETNPQSILELSKPCEDFLLIPPNTYSHHRQSSPFNEHFLIELVLQSLAAEVADIIKQ